MASNTDVVRTSETCHCQLPGVNPVGLCWECRKPRVGSDAAPRPWRLFKAGERSELPHIADANGRVVARAEGNLWVWQDFIAPMIVAAANAHETFDIPVQRVVNAAGTAAYDTPQIVECNEDGSLLEPPTQKANERPKCSGTMGCHVHWSGWPTHHPNCSDHPNNRSVKSEGDQRG